jgi:hypothetical protein
MMAVKSVFLPTEQIYKVFKISIIYLAAINFVTVALKIEMNVLIVKSKIYKIKGKHLIANALRSVLLINLT